MRCTAVALGASVLALALTAGPALAEPAATQAVDDSTGAAQVGAVAVSAPVRVASDGGGETAAVTTGSPQTTNESTGAAQVTSVEADAPVRVLSDGDDTGAAPSGAAAGEQTTGDSSGSAQVGSPAVAAPVRVLSDGDDTGAASSGAAAGEQSTGGSTGTAQVGSPTVAAPARVLSESGGAAGDGGDPADVAEELVGELLGSPGDPPTPAMDMSGGGRSALGSDDNPPERLSRLVDDQGDGAEPRPAIELVSGGTSGDAGDVADVAALSAAETRLPLTGLELVGPLAVGLWLLSSGLALRLVPGGKRR